MSPCGAHTAHEDGDDDVKEDELAQPPECVKVREGDEPAINGKNATSARAVWRDGVPIVRVREGDEPGEVEADGGLWEGVIQPKEGVCEPQDAIPHG